MKRQKWRRCGINDGVIAVQQQQQKWQCLRCGNQEQRLFYQYDCQNCHQQCWYCRSCVSFGMMTTCTAIIIDDEEFPLQPVEYAWHGQLSPAQQAASQAVAQWIEQQQTGMVYAVCGAGKTEMMFAGIAQALRGGKRVCWATPRTDVVKELQPRLAQAFPQTVIAAHYQNSPDGQVDAQLVLATTHQLVRYYQAFDCIIIDEVDAFPYTIDQKLARFAERAMTIGGNFIYLTATPSHELRRKLAKRREPIWQIPGRYHRRSLPVPHYYFWGTSQTILKNRYLRKKFIASLQSLITADRVIMVFVPTVDCGERVVKQLQLQFGNSCAFVHSQDPQRQKKVQQFRERELKILVTTTILERGVTIDLCEVFVLDADHEVFDWAALVQISGRVDRKQADSLACVRLFASMKTKAMVVARKEINQCNDLARKRGLIE